MIVLYSAVGLLIATLGGIEAAFGFQKKAGDLRILAAKCKSYILDFDCKALQNSESEIQEQLGNAREVIALQNKALQEVISKAAEIGVNITRKVRKTGSINNRQLETSQKQLT